MEKSTPDLSLPQMEQEILDFWEKKQCFPRSNELRLKTGKTFSFYDGPPFANGLPHYGHMLGQTLKDTVPRYWNMRGYFVERRFGWDCHGLPVEYEVEKKLSLTGRKSILELGVGKFNEECRKTVFHYAGEWQRTVTRLGRWVDWNNQYRTMDLAFMESVWWVFGELYKKGLVYRDKKIVSYSPRITAVVSNFEANLNYKDVQDPSVYIKFKLLDENAYMLAWTTTPWSLPANLAVNVNTAFEYVRIRDKTTNETYYLAKDRLPAVYKKPEDYEILASLKGTELLGRKYEPLFPYYKNHKNAFQILDGDYVTLDSGTGIVHCAPAFGENDFVSCRKHHIELVDPLDDEAKFTDVAPEFAGMFVKDADKQIIRALKEHGNLFRHETLVHSYPHCDRTEAPLIYRAIPTWYVAVEKIKESLVRLNLGINWIPEHLREGRMGKWLENARDWAISRNRFWGTPIPIWISDRDASVIEVIGSVKELSEKTGKVITDLHKHHIDDLTWPCKKTGGTMRRITEVFDCWFESGSMPYSQKHYPFENQTEFNKSFPADFIAEGQDQTRGWFYTLNILAGALFEKPAFHNVVVNGTVLAADGKKMSKRLKNYTAPDTLLDKFGADSVRLYMINSPVIRGDDLRFNDEGVRDTTRSVILPIWNSYTFLSTYAEADGWQPSVELASGKISAKTDELDQWILSRLQTLTANLHVDMEAYRIYNVVNHFLAFIDELTNWYIRLSRRRFWGVPGSKSLSQDQLNAYETLFHVLLEFTKLFAPFAPFTCEKLYLSLTHGIQGLPESVHHCEMPMPDGPRTKKDLESRMALVRRTTELGRSLRAKHQIRTRQPLPSVTVIAREQLDCDQIAMNASVIKEELNVKAINFSTKESDFVRLSLKPNLKTLGKKLGKDLGKFRAALELLNTDGNKTAALIADLEIKGSGTLDEFSIGLEDLLIERGPKDHQLIASEMGITVLLDTSISEELLLEGLAREVVNRVQKFRKDSDLNVSDRIKLLLNASGDLKRAIETHRSFIGAETLATSIDFASDDTQRSSMKFSTDLDIEDFSCWAAMSKV